MNVPTGIINKTDLSSNVKEQLVTSGSVTQEDLIAAISGLVIESEFISFVPIAPLITCSVPTESPANIEFVTDKGPSLSVVILPLISCSFPTDAGEILFCVIPPLIKF